LFPAGRSATVILQASSGLSESREVLTNHVAMVSHPDDVVRLIETAAEAASAAS
jgi:hypothetical protein